ncbi:hypothetical protein D1007_01345 [Hordeum vulgare]|nr:hypothetical protein D1007_01345 [Hordeum vulgare]
MRMCVRAYCNTCCATMVAYEGLCHVGCARLAGHETIKSIFCWCLRGGDRTGNYQFALFSPVLHPAMLSLSFPCVVDSAASSQVHHAHTIENISTGLGAAIATYKRSMITTKEGTSICFYRATTWLYISITICICTSSQLKSVHGGLSLQQ